MNIDKEDVISFDDILTQMAMLYQKKNHDYNNSFDESCNEFGLLSPIIRITDKLNRLKFLIQNNSQIPETIEDTLLDMCNYCAMSLKWYKNAKSGNI